MHRRRAGRDFFTGEISGWGLRCGVESPVDEATALQVVSEGSSLPDWEVLSPASAQDAYVFYQPPLDFGQVAVVSPRTGVVTFRGGIVWSGTGTLTTPRSFATEPS